MPNTPKKVKFVKDKNNPTKKKKTMRASKGVKDTLPTKNGIYKPVPVKKVKPTPVTKKKPKPTLKKNVQFSSRAKAVKNMKKNIKRRQKGKRVKNRFNK